MIILPLRSIKSAINLLVAYQPLDLIFFSKFIKDS